MCSRENACITEELDSGGMRGRPVEYEESLDETDAVSSRSSLTRIFKLVENKERGATADKI